MLRCSRRKFVLLSGFFIFLLNVVSRKNVSVEEKTFTEFARPVCQEKVRCYRNSNRFSIHIDQFGNFSFVRSAIFEKILTTIRRSKFYNNDSSDACLHIAPVDTIDRDRRSKRSEFLFFIDQRFKLFKEWNDPDKIHLIFNHYTGTWPDYSRDFDFTMASRTIRARTSLTLENYDCSRDVSFPLFHSDYPQKVKFWRKQRDILLSFKGKSYEDVRHHRSFFHHLHNGKDIRIEFTDFGNVSQTSDDYFDLLSRSKFCLVPSGRRLNSFRFLEALQYSCVPVITTENDESIVLPFAEIIDWSKGAIFYQNRSIALLPTFLRSIGENQRIFLQENSFRFWKFYFSSIERIVLTTIEIIRDRFVFD